jgi:hypothetical protein
MHSPASAGCVESSARRESSNNSERFCPVCNGPVVDMRSMLRCLRCAFTTCVGCDAGGAESFPETE